MSEVPTIERCTKADFDFILTRLTEFWEHDRAARVHHPMFIHEFGNTAFVIRDKGQPVAYLFAFYSQAEAAAYVHLVAVRRSHRGRGMATKLYGHFVDRARAHGCRSLKAITNPSNAASIAFHQRLGMALHGTPNEDGIPVVVDYAGPGEDRVVFHMDL